MQHWLSSTWEANWRSFQYFNLYRLVLAALFFLAIVFPHEWTARLNLLPSPLMFGLTGSYMAATVAGLLLATHWQRRFNRQQIGKVLTFVVAHAACKELAIADRRLKGGRYPFVERVGRLHVVMSVDQQCGRTGYIVAPPVDHGPASRGQ